jgi:hypothetical protein
VLDATLAVGVVLLVLLALTLAVLPVVLVAAMLVVVAALALIVAAPPLDVPVAAPPQAASKPLPRAPAPTSKVTRRARRRESVPQALLPDIFGLLTRNHTTYHRR